MDAWRSPTVLPAVLASFLLCTCALDFQGIHVHMSEVQNMSAPALGQPRGGGPRMDKVVDRAAQQLEPLMNASFGGFTYHNCTPPLCLYWCAVHRLPRFQLRLCTW